MRFRQTLFWDVDPKTINPRRHARYIIERIMDFGNDKEVKWMWEKYPRRLLKDVAFHARVLRPRTKSLWQVLTSKK